MIRINFLIIVLVLAVFGCKQSPEKHKTLLARVGGTELFLEDIPESKLNVIPDEDSSVRLRRYIEKWAEEQYFLQQTSEFIDENDASLKDIIEEYKNNLLIYEMEKKWIENFSDTIVSDIEAEEYYDLNKDNFVLRRNIAKIKYIKLDKSISKKDLSKIITLIKDKSTDSDSLLRLYAETKAENFFLGNSWLYFDDILREIPISRNYNQERFLQNNRFVQLEENELIYLVNFIDFKTKDSRTPLEFEINNIKKYILMQRRARYIENKRIDMLENAYSTGDIKIWTK